MWSTDPIWQASIAEHQLTSEQTQYHYCTPITSTPDAGYGRNRRHQLERVQEAFGAVSVQQHQSRISMNLRFRQYY